MPDASDYVRGETYARRERPRFEFKPSATGYTGGGYARIRSTERRAHTPGDGTDDVFVSVHRLAAVAWHLPEGTLGEDVHLDALDGVDVHHRQPDSDAPGMPAANGEAWTETVTHGTHSEITQSQMRAWGADAKREVERERERGRTADPNACDRCGEIVNVLVEATAYDGQRCLDCGQASGATDFEVV